MENLIETPAEPMKPRLKPSFTLPVRKKGFETAYAISNKTGTAPPSPPDGVFELIKYPAPLGKNSAYVTPVKSGPPRPAIVWIHGGFGFDIGELAWQPAPREDDQSASAFREAGLVLMLPSLRGTNDNPGKRECFLGEVEDVIAAARYLATRPDVDRERIYLGGHSTGGTLVLLVAASTARFRGIFAFGPVLHVQSYGTSACIPQDAVGLEVKLRSPGYFLKEIKSPTFIVEGAIGNGPYPLSRTLIGPAPITATIVPGADHFTVLRPGSEVVAQAILADDGDQTSISISANAIVSQMKRAPANDKQ